MTKYLEIKNYARIINMVQKNIAKKFILVLGDIFLFYFSLFITLIVRYFSLPSAELWNLHIFPFFIINLLWLLIFYIDGFYDIEKKPFINLFDVFRAIAIGGIITILLFYIIPSFGITPKTNLIIDIFITSVLIWKWRKIFLNISVKTSKVKIFFLENSKEIGEIKQIIKKNPYLGYELSEDIFLTDVIVVNDEIKNGKNITQLLYKAALSGKTIVNFINFYESITNKFPSSMIGKICFLKNITWQQQNRLYDLVKKFLETITAVLLLIFLLPFLLLIFLLIKMTSEGPVILKQKRIGKNEKEYYHYKFRTMNTVIPIIDKDEWVTKDDSRITRLGKFLRITRIDELPQLWNIIKGDISFIGPRPDLADFYKILKREIPYYSSRTIVKPGLTGWAQIHNQFGGSVEQAKERLAYEIYYIKNRFFFLDLLIILKTVKIILSASGI